MRDRRYTILSTASLPLEKMPQVMDSIEIRSIPFIEILSKPDEKIKARIGILAGEKLVAIFTSAYAVLAVEKYKGRAPDWQIYNVGKETASAIRQAFGENSIVQTAPNAQTLSEIIINAKIKQAVFFCGNQRLDILPANLSKAGIALEEIMVYETRLTPVHLDFLPDAVLFFSPTAVRSFFSVNVLHPATKLFAMGTTTAATLKEFTKNPVLISPQAEKAHVLNMALEFAGLHPIK